MKEIVSKYIIVGAGLSGLSLAHKLHQSGENSFILLESRDQIGGRIITENHIDLGATWFQSYHENVTGLLKELGISEFHQYSKGQSVLVYNSMAPAHIFESDPNAPSAYRIAGGSSSMIHRLATPFRNKILLNSAVDEVRNEDGLITVKVDSLKYSTEKIVITIPPHITTRIKFSPQLPEDLLGVMNSTHTWMSNAIKVGMTFKSPFWKDKGFSGTIIGQIGPVVELYDHTDYSNNHFALMGFVNEALRDLSPTDRKKSILDYISKYLGDEVLGFLSYSEKDWSQDKHTSCETIKSIYMSLQYGNPVFGKAYLEGKLFFAGAETSPLYGGYMDGAIYSGISAYDRITRPK